MEKVSHSGSDVGIDMDELFSRYAEDKKLQENVKRNVERWKCIHGGLQMVKENPLNFDPIGEYWEPPERLIAVAYFAKHWTGRCAPVASVRRIANRVFNFFDDLRSNGLLTEADWGVNTVSFTNVREKLIEKIPSIGSLPAWDEARTFWVDLPRNLEEHITGFLVDLKHEDCWKSCGFQDRIPWFAYLGAHTLKEVEHRRKFLYGYMNLWTTTNAYVSGGGQTFASVMQNTNSTQLIEPALRWTEGETTLETGLFTRTRGDIDDQNRANSTTTNELYGFLNLESQPFYNNRADLYKQWFALEEQDPHELVVAVGRIAEDWLMKHREAREPLCNMFDSLVITSKPISRVKFELIRSTKAIKKAKKKGEPEFDYELLNELNNGAIQALNNLSEKDKAACALHLLLDAHLYESTRYSCNVTQDQEFQPKLSASVTTEEVLELPLGLRGPAEQALTYLSAGLHVLFAGAPGTGKTTLAQFVGYAWNSGFLTIPDSMSKDQAPITTVGNSAWSPFHTIGGLMPRCEGGFRLSPGVFIQSEGNPTSKWKLHDGAIVLDELNRADLDRCIGELYPLLTGSVTSVVPAGLPGIEEIENSPRFRVLATINDSTIDDIVFPISEGLARRFQRIELPGASIDDVLGFLDLAKDEVVTEKSERVQEAVGDFFEALRNEGSVLESGRLCIGAGYFALLKAWLHGKLTLVGSFCDLTISEQARSFLLASLSSLRKSQKWRKALDLFENSPESAV